MVVGRSLCSQCSSSSVLFLLILLYVSFTPNIFSHWFLSLILYPSIFLWSMKTSHIGYMSCSYLFHRCKLINLFYLRCVLFNMNQYCRTYITLYVCCRYTCMYACGYVCIGCVHAYLCTSEGHMSILGVFLH